MWRQTAKFGLELCFDARRFLGVSASGDQDFVSEWTGGAAVLGKEAGL